MRLTLPGCGLTILAAVSVAVIPACNNIPFAWETGGARGKKTLVCFKGHTDSIAGVGFSPDGKMVLSSSLDGTIRLWDAAGGQEIRCVGSNRWSDPSPISAGVIFPSDGRAIIFVDKHQSIREWDLKSGFVWDTPCRFPHPFQGHLVNFSPDASQLASLGADNTILVWDVKSGKKRINLKGHSDQVNAVVFTPDGRVLSGGADGSMRLWDLATGKELRKFAALGSSSFSVACSPSGFLALAGEAGGLRIGERGTIRLWDVETGEAIRNLEGHDGPVNCVAFSPDGRRALSGSGFGFPPFPDSASLAALEDHTLRLWDVATGNDLARFARHSSA